MGTAGQIQNSLAVSDEGGTLQRLGEEVSQHVCSWAIRYTNLLAVDVISDEILPDFYMSGAFGTGAFSVVLQQDSTLVILVYYIVCDGKSLSLEKPPGPEDKSHGVIDTNQLSLSGTASIELLFG